MWLLFIVALFSLGAFNFSFVLLNAREMGVDDALIPVVYAVLNVTHTIVAIPVGRLADRIGKEKALVIGYIIFAVTALLLYITPRSVPAAFLIAAVFGFYMGVVETVQRAMIPGYVDSSLRGTAYGIYYLVVGLSFFVANSVVGSLWQTMGLWASSVYSGTLTSLAVIGLILFTKGR